MNSRASKLVRAGGLALMLALSVGHAGAVDIVRGGSGNGVSLAWLLSLGNTIVDDLNGLIR